MSYGIVREGMVVSTLPWEHWHVKWWEQGAVLEQRRESNRCMGFFSSTRKSVAANWHMASCQLLMVTKGYLHVVFSFFKACQGASSWKRERGTNHLDDTSYFSHQAIRPYDIEGEGYSLVTMMHGYFENHVLPVPATYTCVILVNMYWVCQKNEIKGKNQFHGVHERVRIDYLWNRIKLWFQSRIMWF